MSILKVAAQLERVAKERLAARQTAAPKAKRGMFALVERRHSSTMMHGATHGYSTFTPCIVSSIDRTGIVQAVKIAGQDWPLKRRDWSQITVDSRCQIADPEAVAAKLVDDAGRAIEYRDQVEAVTAIKAASGMVELAAVEPAIVPSSRGNATVVELRPRQSAALAGRAEASPNAVNETKRPKRVANAERRPREHLSRDEVLALCKAARSQNRSGARDAAAIWLAFNHGLRVSELVDLRWSDVRWDERKLMVRRLKGSQSGEHPLTEADKRALGPIRDKRARPSDTVFGISAAGFRKMLARLDLPADLADLAVHPHMLRHACGYDMVGRADLQARAAFMGHKRLENTVRYSHLDADQFEGLRP